uniref:U3 small nucleolar RNA-associated protein 15 homolog isoform X1 n=2 Tax=Myxine glutinosa TaxID=7769 RepID=UPI00358E4862
MASYRPTSIFTYPQLGGGTSPESTFWRSYKSPVDIKEYGAVTHIDFSPVPPHPFAVTASTRIHVYGQNARTPERTYSRFRDVAHCGVFRHDGRLLVAGSNDAVVRLFDMNGRAALRSFSGHTRAVHAVSFLAGGLKVLSASDDNSVCLWDIATSAKLGVFAEHSDYVRTACASRFNSNLFLTGSYDHSVRIFDAREGKTILTVDHGHPVESVLLLPSEGIFISAGGRHVKVWDTKLGGRLLTCIRGHHKTVTKLALNGAGNRLLVSSLDRHVKVYDTTNYKIVHSFDYPASVLSAAISADDATLAVGMTNGILTVRHRKAEKVSRVGGTVAKVGKWQSRRGLRYRLNGKAFASNKAIVIPKTSKLHLSTIDKLLKSFEHSQALDAVLLPHTSIGLQVSIMQELIRRGKLENALAGRNDKQLVVLLNLLIKHLFDARYTNVLVTVAENLIDIYSPSLGTSSVVDERIVKLLNLMQLEVRYQENVMEIMGMMDTLFAATVSTENMEVAGDNSSAADPTF